jgi:hypothetical protein
MPLIPHTNIHPPEIVQFCGSLEIQTESQAAAVSDPAERWRPIMDAAASIHYVDAFPIWLMGNHQCPRNIRMGFCLIAHLQILLFKPDGITLAAERATIAWHTSYGKSLGHNYRLSLELTQ